MTTSETSTAHVPISEGVQHTIFTFASKDKCVPPVNFSHALSK